MSSFQFTTPSNSLFDEHQWVVHIRKHLCQELDDDEDTSSELPVSIFNVPKTLITRDPECYVPQQVAIGPYHYWRLEMHEMESYKLGAAKRMQRQLEDTSFEDLVRQLMSYEVPIRACYHKYLTFNSETLAWMMAVDACFLLEFLQIYALKQGTATLIRISSRMSHLVDIARRKSAHNAILRDIVMLENQIPLFLLRKVLEVQHSSIEMADEKLYSMLMGLFDEISPFKKMKELPQLELSECTHLLDFLYHLIVPKFLQPGPSEISEMPIDGHEEQEKPVLRSPSHLKKLLNEVWKILSKLNKGPVRILKNVLLLVTKLPWKVVSKLPGAKMLQGPLGFLCSSQEKEEKPENEDHSSSNNNKPPLIEEIAIPSVTELFKAGVEFLPTNEGILSIRFDDKTGTFYLPSISLDSNTEVILKNLVAYEACNARGPVLFTRYTELMNGIIDTKEDARILRENGIILNRLKSDEDVTKLWNGMDRSVRLTKAPILDRVIEDVNKFYHGRWKVKVRKYMKAYIYGSWQFLTLLACIMLLLLTVLQAFCSVYSCKRILNLDDEDSD